MQKLLTISILFVLVGCGNTALHSLALAEEIPPTPTATVIELFTSQGCSSCPPADEMLAQIVAWSEKDELPVYCLSFHVDYWNSLGWTDPFSSRQFTQRQHSYARAFKSSKIYTPQMIVNGETEFVGSRGSDAVKALQAALASKNENTIALKAMAPKDKSAVVQYSVTGRLQDCVLNVVLAQKSAENNVPRGENAGRALVHVNVARVLETVPLTAQTGQVEIAFPEGLHVAKTQIIAYIQNRKTMQIRGAAAAHFEAGEKDNMMPTQ